MKIGVYDPYLDDLGGGEKYMMTIASCLSKENDVTVFWNNKKNVEMVGERFSLDMQKVKVSENIFSQDTSLIRRFLSTKDFDIIIMLTDGSIPLVGAKKLFLHIQQPLEAMQVHSLMDKIKLSRISAFFCNSEFTRSFIEKRFPIKTKVVYPPVSFYPKKVVKENIILHVGRFRSINGQDYKKQGFMIEAFKKIVDHGLKDWQFVVAASVHEKDMGAFEKMQQQAKGYPIEFLINQSNDTLWEIYAKAKIYWHASGYGEDLEAHPELAEHFGISTVEAMGAGAVPVVINAGGQKEIVTNEENGLLWNNDKDLEDQTLRIIKDKDLWKRLSLYAQERAKDFTGDRFCNEITQLIS